MKCHPITHALVCVSRGQGAAGGGGGEGFLLFVRPVVTRRTPVLLLASQVTPVPSSHPLVGGSPGAPPGASPWILLESSSRGAVLDADHLIGGSPRALGVPRWALMSPR